jgi:hypothetical protein
MHACRLLLLLLLLLPLCSYSSAQAFYLYQPTCLDFY